MAAQHSVNHHLENLISDLSTTISTFREEISPEGKFNYEVYQEDWEQQKSENEKIMERIKQEMICVHESLVEQEENAHRDRKLLYTEIQNTNRRVMVGKTEIREDFASFSKVLNQLNRKMMKFLQSSKTLLEMTTVMSQVTKY